ncbi:MAG: DivIVA domain-containing protein [Candidatus Paraimprobicoccus trichonymphae]|uniref:DivIVA domain-containing protein n=1 Tax=Candidatus Paraimprobicoccus trichonymphae TaxID=3033793 RepID=A0AA48IHB2_9FIRM|nr:MAG: DivIVA domain-containing protein [Candidatus Paraimprobicoccus trichonymphae]
MIGLEEIKNVNFSKSFFGGYKPEEVDKFIDGVELSYGELLKEKSDLLYEIQNLRKKLNKYISEEESVRNAIISAQKFVDDSKSKACLDASEILLDAKSKMQIELESAQKIRNEVIKFKEEILNHYKEHVKLITQLPEKLFIDVKLDPNIINNFETVKRKTNSSEKVVKENIDDSKKQQFFINKVKSNEFEFGENYDLFFEKI